MSQAAAWGCQRTVTHQQQRTHRSPHQNPCSLGCAKRRGSRLQALRPVRRTPLPNRAVRFVCHNPVHMQGKDLDVGWLQTTDEVHLLVPTTDDVQKADLNFQVHPNRLKLTVKGETLLSGELPEAVDIDGMVHCKPCSSGLMHSVAL